MKISLDGFDNTIACSDLELGNIICIDDENGFEILYFISMIDREDERILLKMCEKTLFGEYLSFDKIVERNAYKLIKPQI